MDKKRTLINLIITVLTLLGVCIMTFRNTGAALTASGIENLKFFTVLSNVFRGVISAVMTVFLWKKADKKIEKLSVWNYAATCSVGLTFLVVFAFFAPLYGLARVMGGANIFFHLVIPVLAMVEYIVFNTEPVRMPKSFTAILPPLVYGICYLINLLVNGIGYGPDSNDWYGFAIWGMPVGLCIFAVICVASFLIGLLLSRVNVYMLKRNC